ncbi:MAG: hypothetical protein KAV87_35875 [Desulfobacteraceae bacterium]|nr:hypothetical protein [Desulfobacteraceae bacterium]
MAQSIKQRIQALSVRKDAGDLKFLLDAARTELVALRALANELRTDTNAMNDLLNYETQRDGVIGGNFVVGEGSDDTTMVRVSGTIYYRIGGIVYSATDVEGDLATGEITADYWGAWRIMLGKTGAITTQRATANGTSGTMAYADGQDSLLNLSQIARSANTVDVGYLTIDAVTAGFTPGTDLPVTSDANVTVATYYTCRVPRLDNGFTATPSVGLSEGTNDDEYAFGTINVRTNGLNIAQIAADVTIAFADADVITTSGKYGGELFVTDLAGTGVMSLASTGISGGAQTVDIASAALVNTALDAVQLALPQIFTVIGRVVVLANKSTFTFNTDDLAGTDGTATWTDEVAANYDRTNTSGTGVGIDKPDIPDVCAAAATTESLAA